MRTIEPLYMWAGGKRKLIKHYEKIFPNFSDFDNYVEPFFGGGAVFCWVMNSCPTMNTSINDINPEIMGIYEAIRSNPSSFESKVREIGDEYFSLPADKEPRKEWYYENRKKYWANPSPELLFFLMRTGFNGIWQTCSESNGLFGTPAGLLNQKTMETILKTGQIEEWSQRLQKSIIKTGDYSLSVPQEWRNDSTLVFLDPPYRDSFTTYSTVFGDDEQNRVCDFVKELAESGCTVAFSNRTVDGDDFFEDRLSEHFDFHYIPVTYTAGRRKKTNDGYEAKPAVEFLALSKNSSRPTGILF